MRGGRQLDEVLVAGLVFGQKDQVMINVAAPRGGLLVEPAAGRDIDLAADDWLDALLARLPVEIHRPVEHPVVRDGQRGELQLTRPLHQTVQAARPIEQRILGVQVQMNKVGVRHEYKLPPAVRAEQERDQRCGYASALGAMTRAGLPTAR